MAGAEDRGAEAADRFAVALTNAKNNLAVLVAQSPIVAATVRRARLRRSRSARLRFARRTDAPALGLVGAWAELANLPARKPVSTKPAPGDPAYNRSTSDRSASSQSPGKGRPNKSGGR
jgi:hypothetical protein